MAGPESKSLTIDWLQVQNVTAKYVMKCDDDTFVRVDSVLKEVEATAVQGLYMGSMNEFHRPLRTGKWAVTFEVICCTHSETGCVFEFLKIASLFTFLLQNLS